MAASGAGGAADTERTVVRYVVNSPGPKFVAGQTCSYSQWCGSATDTERTIVRYVVNSSGLKCVARQTHI